MADTESTMPIEDGGVYEFRGAHDRVGRDIMGPTITPGRLYILTARDGRALVIESERTPLGVALEGGLYATDDGRLVQEAYHRVGPSQYPPIATPYRVEDLEDVGAAEDVDAFMAAKERTIRTNCRLDAPAGYTHRACEAASPTPCPVTLPPHFGCDHDAAPCQEAARASLDDKPIESAR